MHYARACVHEDDVYVSIESDMASHSESASFCRSIERESMRIRAHEHVRSLERQLEEGTRRDRRI